MFVHLADSTGGRERAGGMASTIWFNVARFDKAGGDLIICSALLPNFTSMKSKLCLLI